MTTYLSILRGINVSGQKKILMADLKALYEELGFKHPVTYIQSGNVVFEAAKLKDTALSKKIETAISKRYGFDVPVIVRTAEEIQALLKQNPFLKKKGLDTEKLHVTFLNETPAAAALTTLQSINYPPDEFIVAGQEIFLHCPVNYGETKLSNKFFESKLKVSATTRNWKTVNTLAELTLNR